MLGDNLRRGLPRGVEICRQNVEICKCLYLSIDMEICRQFRRGLPRDADRVVAGLGPGPRPPAAGDDNKQTIILLTITMILLLLLLIVIVIIIIPTIIVQTIILGGGLRQRPRADLGLPRAERADLRLLHQPQCARKHIYIYMNIYIYIYMYMYAHIHIYIYTHTYTCKQTCVYIYIELYTYNMLCYDII